MSAYRVKGASTRRLSTLTLEMPYIVTVEMHKVHGAEWVVLRLVDEDGQEGGCRWHTDAARREIAYALEALAKELVNGN